MPAKLTVTRGRRAGTELLLDGKPTFNVGSAATNALKLEEPGVAANHCRLFREDTKFTVFDLCGLGVSVNGQRIARTVLKDGDEIALGTVTLRFESGLGSSKQGRSSPLAGSASGKGSPVASGGSLTCVEGADKGKVWPLGKDREVFTVGRGMAADVVVLDIKCSREHCRVERRPDGYYLVDLGSTNGTKLNGKKVPPSSTTKLKTGDTLKLGYSVLELNGGEERALPETVKMPPGEASGRGPGLTGAAPPAPQPPPPAVRNAPTSVGTGTNVGSGGFAGAGDAAAFDVDFDFGDGPPPAAAAPAPKPTSAPTPPPRPASAAPPPSKVPPRDPEEEAEASLRTFVFDDQPADFGAGAPPAAPAARSVSPPTRTPAPAPKPAPTPAPAPKPSAAPPPPPRPTLAPLPQKPVAAPPPSPAKALPPTPPPMTKLPSSPPAAKKAPPQAEGEDAALRTFVFDDSPTFEEPAPAAPKSKAAPPPPTPPARPEPEDEPEEPKDPALRTFVFEDAPSFEEPAPEKTAPAAKAPTPPPKGRPPTAKVAPPSPSGEDAALRTFVFDDNPTFEESPAPPPAKSAKAAPPPPPAKGGKANPKTQRLDAPDEGNDPALRTFVFEDAPTFDDPADAKSKAPKTPAHKPADDDFDIEDGDRPQGFQTMIVDGAGGDAVPPKPDDQVEDGDGFHTFQFDKPPDL